MRTMEQPAQLDAHFEFDMADFDIQAAFEEALYGIAEDSELVLDEKVRRMEHVVHQGTSDTYQEFVDFGLLAAQMEMMCNHDHALGQAMRSNELLTDFMDDHGIQEASGHEHSLFVSSHAKKDEDEYETDPRTGKKTRKKKRSKWFSYFVR